jgi:hypothetical protein
MRFECGIWMGGWLLRGTAVLLFLLLLPACGEEELPTTPLPATPTIDLFIPVVSPTPPLNQLPKTMLPPERIQFVQNATSDTVTATISGDQNRQYVLRAMGGQMLLVQPTAVSPGILVTVSGADGVFVGETRSGGQLTAVFPATQDYVLSVTTQPGAVNVRYTVTVTVVGGSPPPPQPERIQFAPDAVSAAVEGTLADNGSRVYILQALAGQTLVIDVSPAGSGITISVRGADGVILGWVTAGTRFTAELPSTQDYHIDLTAPANAGWMDYEMVVEVR